MMVRPINLLSTACKFTAGADAVALLVHMLVGMIFPYSSAAVKWLISQPRPSFTANSIMVFGSTFSIPLRMTPEELSDKGIGQLLKDGRFLSESRVVREMQMMGVIWRILEMEINDPECPGKVADYIGNTNFDVDLQMHGEGVMATMAATSKLDS